MKRFRLACLAAVALAAVLGSQVASAGSAAVAVDHGAAGAGSLSVSGNGIGADGNVTNTGNLTGDVEGDGRNDYFAQASSAQ